jgi:hypothetical protein
MKPITIRVWVADETPTAAIDGNPINMATLRDWLLTLDQKYTDVRQITDEELAKIADGNAEREYYQTIRDIVQNLKDEIKDGTITDAEGADEWLSETVDGHHDVIYTYAAMEVCRISKNDSAYFDEFGAEGAIDDGGIAWSKLAYMAMLADVREEIGNMDDLFAAEDEDEEVEAE